MRTEQVARVLPTSHRAVVRNEDSAIRFACVRLCPMVPASWYRPDVGHRFALWLIPAMSSVAIVSTSYMDIDALVCITVGYAI